MNLNWLHAWWWWELTINHLWNITKILSSSYWFHTWTDFRIQKVSGKCLNFRESLKIDSPVFLTPVSLSRLSYVARLLILFIYDFTIHIQNVERQNIERQNVEWQNVECQNVKSDKTSEHKMLKVTKHRKWQNVESDKYVQIQCYHIQVFYMLHAT